MRRLNMVVFLFIYTAQFLFAQEPRVAPQFLWQNHATRTDWSHWIAFDYFGADGYFDMAVSNFEKTALNQITKDAVGLPQRHIGNPTFHPQGRYIIFQAQKDSTLGGEENQAFITYAIDEYLGSPGKGFDNDLWCVDLYDLSFYRLTTLPTRKTFLDTTKVTGVLHPHFSKDGNRVLWAQLYDGLADIGGRGKWGLWQLNVSDFVVQGGIPTLQNTISYMPGGIFGDFTWCESHGWARHDSLVIFCMNAHGQHENHMDIYTFNVHTNELNRLTDAPRVWDEHAQLTADGKHLMWICSESYPFDTTQAEATLRTDYWIMNLDGTNKKRVTFFNDPGHSDYQIYDGERIICADASFSPSGDSLLICTKLLDGQLGTGGEKIMFALYNPSATSVVLADRISPSIRLEQNFPNPFNGATQISYHLDKPAHVSLRILDIQGREIDILVNAYQSELSHAVNWSTDRVASGVYYYQLQTEGFVQTKKMLLLK